MSIESHNDERYLFMDLLILFTNRIFLTKMFGRSIVRQQLCVVKFQKDFECFAKFKRYFAVKDESVLDYLTTVDSSKPNPRAQSKLSRSFLQKEKPKLTDYMIGVSESLNDEIIDAMNEALEDDAFFDLFRNRSKPSTIVNFSEIRSNRDFSHVTLYWESKLAEISCVKIKDKFGVKDGLRFYESMIAGISGRLQRREPQFRSYLMKHIYFKKVPKLFFLDLYSLKMKTQDSQISQMKATEFSTEKIMKKLDDDYNDNIIKDN